MRPCDDNIRKTLELADRMVEVADSGDWVREDVGCGVLYGVLRDSAFKIRKLAEAERDAHIQKGWWSQGKGASELRSVPRQPRPDKLG
jgi:hypothetical protein